MDDRVDNNGGVRDGKQPGVDHRRMDEQIGGDEMKKEDFELLGLFGLMGLVLFILLILMPTI